MDIQHLEYFLQVVRDKSITKAAESLFLSQPALSKTMKKLEQELGVELLIKTPRGVEPTDCGIQLAESAAPLVNAFSHIEEQLQGLSELKKGHVNIGVGPTFGFAYMCAILSRFQALYPNIDVNLHIVSAQKIKVMLKNYELDIGIFNEPQRNEDLGNLQFVAIHQGEMAVVCNKNHSFAHKERVTISDLQEEPMNLYSDDFALHSMVVKHCRDAGFEPTINFTCNAIEILLDLTASGQGICILPRPYAEKICVCFPTNHIVTFSPPMPWVSCLLTRKGSYHSFSTMALSGFIQKYFPAGPMR